MTISDPIVAGSLHLFYEVIFVMHGVTVQVWVPVGGVDKFTFTRAN